MAVTAIIAALPREVAQLVHGVRPQAAAKCEGIYAYALPDVIVVCAGMGQTRATLAVAQAMMMGDVSMLVSAGLAGGCNPSLAAGSVLEAAVVIDALSGERFPCAAEHGATLVTTPAIAGIQEKRRLFAAYGADAVDMEASTIARLAAMRALPFRAIKAISDEHDFELSSLSRFASPHGHFRTGAFALHTAVRPRHWRKAMQLGAASQRALAALTEALRGL